MVTPLDVERFLRDGYLIVRGVFASPELDRYRALAGAILHLIENDSLRSRIATTARKSVAKFAIENTIEQNLALYRELLKDVKGRSGTG